MALLVVPWDKTVSELTILVACSLSSNVDNICGQNTEIKRKNISR